MDGVVAGCALRFPMGHYLGGRAVSSAGIAGVGVAPEWRGQGVAQHMMHGVLAEARAEGFALSTLYASTYGLYRKLGYERAGTRQVLTVDPRQLRFSSPGTRVRPLTTEDEPIVTRLYTQSARLRAAQQERGEYLWKRTRETLEGAAHGVLLLEAEEPVGYLRWIQVDDGERMYRLGITDMALTRPSAAHAALAFFGQHGTLVERVSWASGPGDPLLALLPDRFFELRHKDDWLIRILDARAALEGRGYSSAVRAELHVNLTDDRFAQNTGPFVLHVRDGQARCEAGGDGRLVLDVRGLAPLYTGHMSAHELSLAGSLRHDEESLQLADAIFAGPTPWMTDAF